MATKCQSVSRGVAVFFSVFFFITNGLTDQDWHLLNSCDSLVAKTAPIGKTANYLQNNWGKDDKAILTRTRTYMDYIVYKLSTYISVHLKKLVNSILKSRLHCGVCKGMPEYTLFDDHNSISLIKSWIKLNWKYLLIQTKHIPVNFSTIQRFASRKCPQFFFLNWYLIFMDKNDLF